MRNTVIKQLNPSDKQDELTVKYALLPFMMEVYHRYYPDFNNWYMSKVIQGFKEGSRVIYTVRINNNLVGVSVVKPSKSIKKNSKISSFFLLPEATGKGVGSELLNVSIESLRNRGISKTIIITIPEEKTKPLENGISFMNFLQKHGFVLADIIMNKYRPGKSEFILSLNLEDR